MKHRAVFLLLTLTTLALSAQLHAKPLKVFILAGQSNNKGCIAAERSGASNYSIG